MKFPNWLVRYQDKHSLIKSFLRYYQSNATLQNYEGRKTILRYLMENTEATEIIREFNLVWLMYEQSGMVHIPKKQRVKPFVV